MWFGLVTPWRVAASWRGMFGFEGPKRRINDGCPGLHLITPAGKLLSGTRHRYSKMFEMCE